MLISLVTLKQLTCTLGDATAMKVKVYQEIYLVVLQGRKAKIANDMRIGDDLVFLHSLLGD